MATKNGFQAEKINKHIVKWLHDYATNAKVKGFVVGISGGIDSAVTSTLCAQTGFPNTLRRNAYSPGAKPCNTGKGTYKATLSGIPMYRLN